MKTRQEVAARVLAHKHIAPLLTQTLPGCHQAASDRLARRRCEEVERETGLEPAKACLGSSLSHDRRLLAINRLYKCF